MKKVLFVLGLALCSTFAMAQTNKVVGKVCTPATNEKVVFAPDVVQIDYKASIFTKDSQHKQLIDRILGCQCRICAPSEMQA